MQCILNLILTVIKVLTARWSEAETMQDCQPCSKPVPRLGCLAYSQKDRDHK